MAFSDPEQNIAQFNLQHGAHVADFGAGSGFYTLAIARALGGGGKVYAIDVQKDLLARIKNEAQRQHLANVEVLWADVEKIGGTKLHDASLDAVVASNIMFQLTDRRNFIEEIKRILKAKGKVMVIDWSDAAGTLGPKPENIIRQDSVRELFLHAGFVFESSIAAGNHHYGLIFRKS